MLRRRRRAGPQRPALSVVVVFYNMIREAPRTLYTLSRAYQRDVDDLDYEVIAVDNGSLEPLDPDMVTSFGREFRYLYLPTTSVSPSAAVNVGAAEAAGTHIAVSVDGARLASPGLLHFSALGVGLAPSPVVTTLAWHLGHAMQNLALLDGYDQEVEDRLLEEVDWRSDGYSLFTISVPAGSSTDGWFRPLPESNFVTVQRSMFETLSGFDERFRSPGGGLVNHDFLKRALTLPGSQRVMVLGEGTFHQFHGGVATNVPMEDHPWAAFDHEYAEIRGEPYSVPESPPIFVGTMPNCLLRTTAGFVASAIEHAERGAT